MGRAAGPVCRAATAAGTESEQDRGSGMSQVALVTGTSSGMGLHTAVGLAARGVQVVATMRDPAKAGALQDAATAAGVQLEVRALDVTDAAGAQSCVDAV